jgi:hypothetical protein
MIRLWYVDEWKNGAGVFSGLELGEFHSDLYRANLCSLSVENSPSHKSRNVYMKFYKRIVLSLTNFDAALFQKHCSKPNHATNNTCNIIMNYIRRYSCTMLNNIPYRNCRFYARFFLYGGFF